MIKTPVLIGIGGENGAGKDTVGQILAEDHGFMFFTVTELLREECRKRGIPVIRKNTRLVSTEWRQKFGLAVLVDKAIDEYKKSKMKYKGLALSSVRNIGESDRIHKDGGLMVWVSADPRVRYSRIQSNKATGRNRTGEDNVSFEQFLAEGQEEMSSTNPNSLQGSEVKKRCDVFIENSGDIDSLKAKIRQALFS